MVKIEDWKEVDADGKGVLAPKTRYYLPTGLGEYDGPIFSSYDEAGEYIAKMTPLLTDEQRGRSIRTVHTIITDEKGAPPR